MKTVKLNNGIEIPILGLGTYQSTDAKKCQHTVQEALSIGYRLIDTAQGYGNESYIGHAITQSGVLREELFITSKVWFKNYENTRVSVEKSLSDLQTDYIDLMLLHWPFGNTYTAWRTLEQLHAEGKIRAIGVSNYTSDRLVDLINYNKIVPTINQIETNLISQQVETRKWMNKYDVKHMGYAPFGQSQIEDIYSDQALNFIAGRYRKTPCQIVLRFQIQSGVIVIPKTTSVGRLKENYNVFDFELLPNEMEILRAFDKETPLIGNPQNPEFVNSSAGW